MAGGQEDKKEMPEVDGYTQVKSNVADIMGMEMNDPHLKSLQQRLFHIENSQIIPPSQKQAMIMGLYQELMQGHFTAKEEKEPAPVTTSTPTAAAAPKSSSARRAPPKYGADTGVYRWDQDEFEVTIEIPVPEVATAKQVAWTITRETMKVGLNGESPLLEGELCARVIPDDCNWQMEKASNGSGKVMVVTLAKDVKTFGAGHWNCVIKGRDCVETASWALDP